MGESLEWQDLEKARQFKLEKMRLPSKAETVSEASKVFGPKSAPW